MVGFAALLLEPIFADGSGIEFLAPAHHRPNGLIGNQRAGDAEDAHEQKSHLSIFEYSSPGCNRIALGACPSKSMGRGPSATPADARRRDAGNVVHCRGAATPQMPACRRNPEGAWGLRASSSLLVVADAPRHRLLLAPRSHVASPMGATHALTRTGS